MSFDPKTKTTWALVLDIYFANGVAISPDQAYVVFCETIMYGEGVKSITSKVRNPGSVDKFIDDLPGVPDNIHYDGQGLYWVATNKHDQDWRSSILRFLDQALRSLPQSA
ncbi:hypothetical protein Q3G72_018768 [Acer saccharum]|nr:hypothetical protein Q3G72_018768 [Acer saccharum]